MESTLYATLKQFYGYDEFRPLQKQIIQDVLDKKDTFVLIPTGGGKSLCYQLPALIQDGITIVVSPLIALMKDQVDNLKQIGAKAAFFNSTLSTAEQNDIRKQLLDHQIKLLYVAPERLMQPEFLDFIQTLPINLFAIDEAHCISEWGHDFRPEYRKLSKLKLLFPKVPIIALTATATARVSQDIIKQLRLNSATTYQASFNRPNLIYSISEKYDALTQILEFLKTHPDQSGIIYCHSRNNVERLTSDLQNNNVKALAYHAGLDDNLRKQNQEQFIKDEGVIMVATVAFGMGIDKPNVRFVIHADLPSNLERYYQETGRAGRDGLDSECVLLFAPGDKEKIKYFINQKTDLNEQHIANTQLTAMLNFAQSHQCRRQKLLEYFGENFETQNCQTCDNCLDPKETFDATIVAQKIFSCIYRTGQRFGGKYIADILTGKAGKQVLQNNHQSLSTFGIVIEYASNQIQSLIQELISNNYLKQTEGKYPVLQLTTQSHAVLKGTETVRLTKLSEKQRSLKFKSTGLLPFDHEVFEHLRSLRKQLADEQNIPPYVIFSDATLRDLSAFLPQTKDQFAQIKGVGQQKLHQYADIFLQKIKKVKPDSTFSFPTKPVITKKTTPNTGSTIRQTVQLFNSGLTVQEIAKTRELSEQTIISHLTQAYLQGQQIDIDSLIPQDKEISIVQAFEKLGTARLAPVKEFLGEDYSYNDLHLVRAKLLKS